MMGEAPRSRPLSILTNLVEAETAYGYQGRSTIISIIIGTGEELPHTVPDPNQAGRALARKL
jgi:hypothetical protein